jgi:hypothetical protein
VVASHGLPWVLDGRRGGVEQFAWGELPSFLPFIVRLRGELGWCLFLLLEMIGKTDLYTVFSFSFSDKTHWFLF